MVESFCRRPGGCIHGLGLLFGFDLSILGLVEFGLMIVASLPFCRRCSRSLQGLGRVSQFSVFRDFGPILRGIAKVDFAYLFQHMIRQNVLRPGIIFKVPRSCRCPQAAQALIYAADAMSGPCGGFTTLLRCSLMNILICACPAPSLECSWPRI